MAGKIPLHQSSLDTQLEDYNPWSMFNRAIPFLMEKQFISVFKPPSKKKVLYFLTPMEVANDLITYKSGVVFLLTPYKPPPPCFPGRHLSEGCVSSVPPETRIWVDVVLGAAVPGIGARLWEGGGNVANTRDRD